MVRYILLRQRLRRTLTTNGLLFILFFPFALYGSGLLKDAVPSTSKQPHRIIISVPEGKKLSSKQYNQWIGKIEKTINQLRTELSKTYAITMSFTSMAATKEQRKKQRKNELSIIHKPKDFKLFKAQSVSPHIVVQVPTTVSLDAFIAQAEKLLSKKRFLVRPDHPVKLAHSFKGLGMLGIKLGDLQKLRAGTLIPEMEKKILSVSAKQTSPRLLRPGATSDKATQEAKKTREELEYLTHRIDLLKKAKQVLFWYQSVPTTGLRKIEDPAYPFIPHNFSLWELAPQKGKGIKVALVDTGVAAFQVASEKQYRKNIDLKMVADFSHDTFNVVGDDNIDPLEQLVYKFEEYVEPKKFNFEQLMQDLPVWIKSYLSTKNDRSLRTYLGANGKKLYAKNNTLTKQGEGLFKKILVRIDDDFSLITLEEPVRKQVVKELMPLAEISDKETTFVSGHGSHTFGVVGGLLQGSKYALTPKHDEGICGLAPDANVLMIKAFDQEGNSARSTLAEAIKRAKAYDVDVLNLSLKVSDHVHSADEDMNLLDRLLGLIPYVVAASGNDGDPKSKAYPGPVESYPGKLSSVEFDVGAFGMPGEDPYNVSHFSQYENFVGPKIVAPGYNILSCGLVPNQKENSVYVFMDGTSMATPIMTGFVALMLGEFKTHFTRRQLLDVCYASVVRLYDNRVWRDKTLLGTVDMRTALFTLHVLKRCKEQLAKSKLAYDFDAHFENILIAIRYLLYYDVDEYSKKHLDGVTMRSACMTFIEQANKRSKKYKASDYMIPSGWNKLNNAIDYVAKGVLHAIDSQWASSVPASVAKELKNIVERKGINIFGHLPQRVQNRLREAEAQEQPLSRKKRRKR